MYGLTKIDSGEWYLGVSDHRRQFSSDPLEALRLHMLWLTPEVAASKLRAIATNTKTLNLLEVSRIELELAPDGWEVAQ